MIILKNVNGNNLFKHVTPRQIIIGFFIVVSFVLFIIFRKEVHNFAQRCFSLYGFVGLCGFVVLMDSIIQPISPDFIILSSTLGGASLLIAATIGGISSVSAGIIGYIIGKKLLKRERKTSFSSRHLINGKALFKKYGTWAVAIGALSPVPYSAICWSAGIYDMRFKRFLLTSLLTRIPRFFIVAFIGYIFS